MSHDQAELQSWYRSAMAERVDELRALRPALAAGDAATFDQARELAQQLRGSGATFGFPEVSEVAGLLEQSDDAGLLRRLEGTIGALRGVVEGSEESQPLAAEWLPLAAGLPADSPVLEGATEIAEAWSLVSAAAGISTDELAERVATYFGLEVASFENRSPSAERLVPSALIMSGRIVPVDEDLETIIVVSADPTSLPMELELRRFTGRAPAFQVASPAAIDAQLEVQTGSPPPPPAPPLRASTPVEEEAIRQRHVLVVDDQSSARILLRGLLEKRDCIVTEAGDGLEALAVLNEGVDPHLVVIDLNMPRMDGLELIWELRADPRWERLPLIVVTAETDEILEAQLMEEGADDYITKPLDAQLFLARIDATLRRLENAS